MRDLIILGAGVHAGEMAQIVDRLNAQQPTWRLLGFADRKTPLREGAFVGLPILGGADVIERYPDACFVPDNSWPRDIAPPDEKLITLIDPSCFVSRTASIGPGCVLYPGCFVGLNARLGRRTFCLSSAVINHDNVIGDHVVFASKATLAGYVHVEDEVYLGQSCTVRQSLRIGRKSVVGMGAVVVKDVAPGVTVAGNPARILVKR